MNDFGEQEMLRRFQEHKMNIKHSLIMHLFVLVLLMYLPVTIQGQWVNMGPDGGMVISLKSFSDQPDVILATVINSGLYRSADRGESWNRVLHEKPADVAVGNGGTAWVCTEKGVYQSNDYGKTWTSVFNTQGYQVVLHDSIVAVHVNDIDPWQISMNYGETFSSWNINTSHCSYPYFIGVGNKPYSFMFHEDGSVFMTYCNSLYKTVGLDLNNWGKIYKPSLQICTYYLSCYPAADSIFYMCAENVYLGSMIGGCSGGLIWTHNGGISWTGIPGIRSVTALAEDETHLFAGDESGKIYLFDKTDHSVEVIGNLGVEIRDFDIRHWDQGELIVATLTGIYKTINSGAAWFRSNTGMKESPVFAVQAIPRDNDETRFIAVLNPAGVFISDDGGETWQNKDPAIHVNPGMLQKAPSDPTILYGGSEWILFSRDGGESWSTIDRSSFDLLLPYYGWDITTGVIDITIYPDDANQVIFHYSCHSDDDYMGEYFLNGQFNSDNENQWEWSIHSWYESSYDMYTSSRFAPDGLVLNTVNMPDFGCNWELISLFPDSLEAIETLDLIPSCDDIFWFVLDSIIVVTDRNVLSHSSDKGKTWTTTTVNFCSDRTYHSIFKRYNFFGNICLSPDQSALYLIIPGNGILMSQDMGKTWQQMDWGLPTMRVYQIDFSPYDPQIAYIATDRGVFRRDMNIVSIHEEKTIKPEKISLYQNYPNPFNPTTTIRYSLPEASHVTLNIYDITGRLVEQLVNQHIPAGYHTVTWDASRYSSGIYFARMQAEDFMQAKKMVFMK